MLTPYIAVTFICIVLIVVILVYILTRHPRARLDDGKHKILYATLIAAAVVGLIFGWIHVLVIT